MMELKAYFTGILKALHRDCEIENVQFEPTEDGYRITFRYEYYNTKEKRRGGTWWKDGEIIVKLSKPYWETWEYEQWHGYCTCKNCCEEDREKITDKDKTAPSS